MSRAGHTIDEMMVSTQAAILIRAEASWFETREGALLTMRVWHGPYPEEHREAMRLEV
jgi:hypothetical protein